MKNIIKRPDDSSTITSDRFEYAINKREFIVLNHNETKFTLRFHGDEKYVLTTYQVDDDTTGYCFIPIYLHLSYKPNSDDIHYYVLYKAQTVSESINLALYNHEEVLLLSSIEEFKQWL